MSRILKLVKLDIAILKPYYKYFLLVILCSVPMMFGFKAIIVSMNFVTVMLSLTSSYIFSVAEKNQLNRLYGLLPVSKKNIVTGRYIFTLLIGVFGVIFGLIANLIIFVVIKIPIVLDEVLLGIGLGIFLYSLFTAIQLPGFFKFGAIKGKFFTFIPLLGLFFGSVITEKLRLVTISKLDSLAILNSPFGMLIIAILFAIVLYCISIGITQKIYDRMEL